MELLNDAPSEGWHAATGGACEPSEPWVRSPRSSLGGTWRTGAATLQHDASQANVARALAAARWILDLEEDWDGEGAVVPLRATMERCACFLRDGADFTFERAGRPLAAPDIGPGPQGSLDIHWKGGGFELLVNVPRDPARPLSFYGDKGPNEVVRGTSTDVGGPLREWMATYLT